jgi:glucose/arabinose dehydrogenase
VARTAGGTVYATQGVYSATVCPDTPRDGVIQRVGGGGLETVAAGFRNPMYMRCHPRDEVCLAAELGDDGGASDGAREKIVLVRPSTNYGFPCCSTTDRATSHNGGRYNCANVTREEASFPLNDTPFGLDWERGRWPEPFRNVLVVALHGSFYSSPPWAGARLVFAATDPNTHAPIGPWMDFVLGFDFRGGPLDRPTDVAFSPDGRMFFADDHGNAIYWVAPEGLRLRAP